MSSTDSLSQLDPSPVSETPNETPSAYADLSAENTTNPDDISPSTHPSYFPPASTGPGSLKPQASYTRSSTTNSLGAAPSRIPYILLALQKYSTIPPTLYLVGHYFNTALIPLFTLSTNTAEKSLLLTRPYYQSFPLEPLLIFIPIATHALSGLALRIYRRFQAGKRYGAETHSDRVALRQHQHKLKRSGTWSGSDNDSGSRSIWPKLSLNSALGYALYPMLAAHVIVNRFTPLKVHGDSSSVGLRFFAHGVARHPLLANLGYSVMVSVASWHFVGGAAKFLRLSAEYVGIGDGLIGEERLERRQKREWWVNGISALVALGWIAGGLGVVGRGIGAEKAMGYEIKAWEEVYRNVPIVGGMM